MTLLRTNSHDVESFLKRLQDEGVIDVDFRFTDPQGGWHHITFHQDGIGYSLFEEGIAFDGSSIAGWKPVHDSDMALIPDLSRVIADPFTQNPTLIVLCDVLDPDTQAGYTRDPRTTARKAEAHLKRTGLADRALFGPEPEFFIFDSVHFDVNENYAFYNLCSDECSNPSSPFLGKHQFTVDHLAHRPNKSRGYAPVAPIDRLGELRSEMLLELKKMGIGVLKHHHEVAAAQHELGFDCGTLLETADNLQLFKYGVRNVAHRHGKTVTFMPKPVYGDNGSGMHVHQSLWQAGVPLFSGDLYNGLSEAALYYIGGILKHAKALNALTNPSTNSYKRLIPGYEAPVYRAYSARNRSAAIRIPYSAQAAAKRIEVRFPDPLANPYLALAGMLMAGLDGIKHKIHPGDAIEENLYKKDLSSINNDYLMSTTLRQALEELSSDRAFLTDGDVFSDDQIDSYIELKQAEADYVGQCPNPTEFKLYYSG